MIFAAGTSSCGLVPGSGGGEDECTDVPQPVVLELKAMAPLPPSAPAIAPTIETYKTCSAMQDDLRTDWQTHSTYRNYPEDDGYYTPVAERAYPRPSAKPAPRKQCPGTVVAARSAAKESDTNDGAVAERAVSAPVAAGASGGAATQTSADKMEVKTFTNVQEKGVDEADTVKIGDHHIYVLQGDALQVINRQTMAPIGVLHFTGLAGINLYADGDTLVATGNATNAAGVGTTSVQILAAAEGQMPLPQKTHELTGYATDSRYVNGHLVLVFRDFLPWNAYGGDPTAAPIAIDGDAVHGIPCDRIVKASVHDFDSRFVKVVSLDARHPDGAPQFTAAIGGGDQIYMTESALYLTKAGIEGQYGYRAPEMEKLLVTKLAFDADTGAVSPVASGLIDGRVKDQWAFQEYAVDGGKVLSVATSTGSLLDHYGAAVAQNHLWVLRQNETSLDVAAVIHDFGTGEDIRSVRYVNDMAYVVTFKKTDPLFAFAMANPLAPKLLGELKVPGFSVYMHPVAPGRMLGIGFDADDQGEFAWYQGLQVSLFDVSDPMALNRLDNVVLGQRGSYSDVTGDHHAFFFDESRMLVGMPAVLLGGKAEDKGSTMATELAFSGAIFYKVEAAKLTEAARVSHADLLPDACKAQLASGHWWQDKTVSLDINRMYSVDGKLLTVSRFGLKTWDPEHLDQPATATLAFTGGDAAQLCGGAYQYGL